MAMHQQQFSRQGMAQNAQGQAFLNPHQIAQQRAMMQHSMMYGPHTCQPIASFHALKPLSPELQVGVMCQLWSTSADVMANSLVQLRKWMNPFDTGHYSHNLAVPVQFNARDPNDQRRRRRSSKQGYQADDEDDSGGYLAWCVQLLHWLTG